MMVVHAAAVIHSSRLLDVLSDFDQFLIVMHDNPDPDAIATGWAIVCLIEEKLGKPSRLISGGAIVRAENRHMVDLLSPPVELVSNINVPENTGTILVDCGLGTTNQMLTRQAIHPTAVIDHHINGKAAGDLSFRDIRPDVAASASIAASYLREQCVEPGPKLATALLYAIHTETRGYETHYSRLDRLILLWLTERADPGMLAEIENAPLAREYYGDLVLAMQSTFIYDDSALCLLPRAEGPEIVGEVADLLIRCKGVRRVLCGAVVGDDLLVSARTQYEHDNAAELLRAMLAGLGSAGGHAHRAGGKIPGVGKISDELQNELRARWLRNCNVNRQRGTRLVAKRDIMENL